MNIKGFDKDLKCRGFQFEVGKEYKIETDKILKLCSDNVFHYCRSIKQVHEYYDCSKDNRYCEIKVIGDEVSDEKKCGSNHIQIVREIVGDELNVLIGKINGNTGLFNSGDSNSGNGNSGSYCSCNFSAGIFMSKRISYEAFDKQITENQFNELKESKGYSICLNFRPVKYRVRTQSGMFGDYKYMSYKNSWAVFWSKLTFKERCEVRNMPFIDFDVFYEITGVKL